jgi:hypothetical protein
MPLSRKQKVDCECRILQEKWTDEYFCVSMNGKALCLICSANIARHYNPNVRSVEMIDFFAENFKMRLNDFSSHATNIRIFETNSWWCSRKIAT